MVFLYCLVSSFVFLFLGVIWDKTSNFNIALKSLFVAMTIAGVVASLLNCGVFVFK